MGIVVAVYRICLGGDLVIPSSLSAILVGSLAGLYYKYKLPKAITVSNAILFTIAVQILARFISLGLSPDLEQAIVRNKHIFVQMILGHAAAVGLFIYIFNAISDRRRLELEVQRLDRFNLIGEMATGIAHEIRNPLTTVRGYLQLFQRRVIFSDHIDQLNTMIEEIDRANSIITEFLSLAKNKAVQLTQGNLNSVVDSLFPLFQADAFVKGHQVMVEMGTIPDTKFDEREIRQLILNLTRNALEAMETSGLLTIKTYHTTDAIILEISDTGPGISEKVLEEHGKPFVTTKDNGTGLGLPICYRIANRHSAEIKIQNYSNGASVGIIFKNK